jgi:hypothetical protein
MRPNAPFLAYTEWDAEVDGTRFHGGRCLPVIGVGASDALESIDGVGVDQNYMNMIKKLSNMPLRHIRRGGSEVDDLRALVTRPTFLCLLFRP